jgi:hypothetical protein
VFANLRANAWKFAALLCAVLAVAVFVYCLFLRVGVSDARLRADAAEVAAKSLAGQVAALKEAGRRDAVAQEATTVAREAAAKRQPEQEARAAKVKGYADSAAGGCVADPRIVRELEAGESRFRAASDRLRGQ